MRDTIVEQFAPVVPTHPVPADLVRWQGCVSYTEYRARVLEMEAARAARKVA